MHATTRRCSTGVAVAAVVGLGAVTGCGARSDSGSGGGSGDKKSVRMGALYLDAQGFYGGIRKGIQTGAASESLKLLGQNSQGDAARESSFMSTLVGSKVDAIIMSPVSDTASVPVVRAAAHAGIPVVCYNTCVSGDAAKKFVKALVTTDQVKMGRQVGDLSGQYFLKHAIKAPRVAILNCDVYEACHQRKAGFKRALSAKVPGVQYVADQAGFLPDKAPTTAADILTAKPNVDAIYATTDNGTLGALKGIEATKHVGRTVVLGSDISVQVGQAMLTKPKTLVLTVGQDAQRMGRVAVHQALLAVSGKRIREFNTYIPTTEFTSDNPQGVHAWLAAHKDGLP